MFWKPSFSQDVLYTLTGSKLKAKVLEINTTDIKYKDFLNIDGPTYVISKTDIVLIKYENGSTDIINSDPPSLLPTAPLVAKTETVVPGARPRPVEKKPMNLYYLNSNMLSINALALANGDITLMYDREFYNSRLSVSVLGGYNINSRMGALNALIVDSRDNAKKNYDAGLGINFMPRNTKRVQYFAGLLGKYMSYNYKNVVDTTNNQLKYEGASGSQMAIMFTNGWIYRISPSFNFKIFGSIGAAINTPALREIGGLPKVYLGYCFGYRF